MAFGLVSTSLTGTVESLRNRRRIFYQYPTGAAQLMGLLSLLPEQYTDKSDFGWWERRFPTQRTTTLTTGVTTSTPFSNADGSVLTDGGTGVNLLADTEYRINLTDTSDFKRTHVIELRLVNQQSGVTNTITGTVTQVNSATSVTFRPDAEFDGVVNLNTSTPNNEGITVAIIGTANAEGARSGSGIIVFPANPTQYTQIFRSAFSLTRTSLKAGLEFDKTGPYAMMAKENGLRHMIEMEKALFWGNKHEVLVADPYTGDLTPEKKLGGIRYFLQQWEMAGSIYRGASSAAVTLNTDDNKRIINAGGTLTRSDYNTYVQRLFRQTHDKEFEKVCFCGAKFLGVINELFDRQVVRTTKVDEDSTNFKFIVHSHETLYGTIHYKVHPLFNEDPDLQGAGMFLDLGCLKYRPLSDSDTMFFKGRQENDRDGRKDEWITEMGLEVQFPEAHMFMQNVLKAA